MFVIFLTKMKPHAWTFQIPQTDPEFQILTAPDITKDASLGSYWDHGDPTITIFLNKSPKEQMKRKGYFHGERFFSAKVLQICHCVLTKMIYLCEQVVCLVSEMGRRFISVRVYSNSTVKKLFIWPCLLDSLDIIMHTIASSQCNTWHPKSPHCNAICDVLVNNWCSAVKGYLCCFQYLQLIE